jgi:hypothetical protein
MNFYSQFIDTHDDKSYDSIRNILMTKYGIKTYLDINFGAYILLHDDNTKTIDQFEDELDKQMIYNTRGLIVEHTLHRPLCMSVPIQIELEKLELPTLKSNEMYTFMKMIEGTYIRMYSHDGTWKFATTRMMDSSSPRSKWSTNKTFKQLLFDVFCKSESLDFSKLNTQYTYQLILQHPENRVVHRHFNHNVYLYGVYDNTTLQSVSLPDSDYIYEVCKPIEKRELTVDETVNISRTIDDMCTPEIGHLIFNSSGPVDMCYKMATKKYRNDAELMMNTASIVERYVKLIRLDKQSTEEQVSQLDKYKHAFPEDISLLDDLTSKIDFIASDVYRLYGLRFKRPSSDMPRRILTQNDGFIQSIHYPILLSIHKMYCEVLKPQQRTVQLEDVKNHILEVIDPKKVASLLNKYINVA